MKRTWVAFALVTGLAAPGVRAQDVGLDLGATPAAVTLSDLDGKPVDLGQYIGKRPVVLEFWATWCPICAALEPMLEAAQKKYGSTVEFVIVAVGVNQTPRSIKRHIEKHAMPGRVVFDGEGKAVRAFLAPTTSYIVVLDGKGRVVYTGSGSEQKLEPVLARLVR